MQQGWQTQSGEPKLKTKSKTRAKRNQLLLKNDDDEEEEEEEEVLIRNWAGSCDFFQCNTFLTELFINNTFTGIVVVGFLVRVL